MVNVMVDRGISILDHYLPSVMDVVHANTVPEDAYAKVEDTDTEKTIPNLPEADSLNDVFPWEHIAGHGPLKAWASELKNVIESKGSDDDWALVGRAVVLVNNDEGYCKEVLRRVAVDAGLKFVSIPDDEVMDMPPASAFRGLSPLLVYLEPDRWILENGDEDESDEDAERVSKFQAKLSDWLREFKTAKPVVFVVSTPDIDKLAERFRRVGLFERFISLPERSLEMTGLDFINKLGADHCGKSLTDSTGKIGRLVTWNFSDPEQRDLAILGLKRIKARENRPVEFLDLVHISTHSLMEEGLVQSPLESVRRQTAYHEAGHAIMAVLESDGKDVPDYTSIVPGASGFGGITVESYGYYFSKNDDQTTYADFRRDVRVSLAGRAAEELLVGPELISNGASGDLENVANQSYRAFARWGFAPAMETEGQSESNLSIIIGKPTPTEYAHIENLTREFVAAEYLWVIKTLKTNRGLLDDVADRLLWDPVVDQDELAGICKKHGVAVTDGH
jgi:cell division protease FtsH